MPVQAGWSRYAGSSQKNGTWPGVVHWFSEDPKETQYDYVLRFDKALPAGEYQVFIHQFYPGKQSVIRDGQEKPPTSIRRRHRWPYPKRAMLKEPAKPPTVVVPGVACRSSGDSVNAADPKARESEMVGARSVLISAPAKPPTSTW